MVSIGAVGTWFLGRGARRIGVVDNELTLVAARVPHGDLHPAVREPHRAQNDGADAAHGWRRGDVVVASVM
jgi:hypothetical protein